MRDLLCLFFWSALVSLVNGWAFLFDAKYYYTDAFTLSWTLDDDEYITQFTFALTYSDGSATTATSFPPMDMDSSTVLPPSFLPAMRPGETSTIDFDIHDESFILTVYDRTLIAPTPDPTTQTVTVTTSGPVRSVTVTKMVSATDAAPSATTTPEEDATEATDTEGSSGGLSTGAKAGIGVGVSAGFLIIGAGVFLLLRYRRQKQEDTIPVIRPSESGTMAGHRLSGIEAKSNILSSVST